jgi:hypothetical protein
LIADKQNLTGDSIQQAGVVDNQNVLGEIVQISLLYHLPDVAFCFTLEISTNPVHFQKHKCGSPVLLHLILVISSMIDMYLINLYNSTISNCFHPNTRLSNHRFLCDNPTFLRNENKLAELYIRQ